MKQKTRWTLVVLLGAGLSLSCACRNDRDTPEDPEHPWTWNDDNQPAQEEDSFYPKPEGAFRIMSYNVGALSKFLANSTEMVAAMVREAEADIVGINELDSVNARHPVNQVALLAQSIGGWQWHFGRAMDYRGGAYGNGVVLPADVTVVDRYTVPLPKGTGSEPRSIAVVETGRYVLGAAHLDHTSEEAVMGQIETIKAWAQGKYRNDARPVFFCGDMNSLPTSDAVSALKDSWDLVSATEPTIPVTAPARCIDYVFRYKGAAAVKVLGAHTMSRFHNGDVTQASDHLPIYVDVQF